MKRSPVRRLAALAAVAVPLALLAGAAVTNLRLALNAPRRPAASPVVTRSTRPRPTRPPAEESIRLARGRCLVHLDNADAEAREALARSLGTLDAFFTAARLRTPRFADRVLGWEGHGHLLAGSLQSSGGNTHATFLAKAFGDTLFTPKQIEAQVDRVVRDCLEAERDVENRLLVTVRRDLADLPVSSPVVTLDERGLRSLIGRVTNDALVVAGAALRDEAARELVALAVGEVLANVVVRAGASAGLLGAGAASSAATFGVGLAAGLVVDQVVSWGWDYWSDPRGALARSTAARVDAIRCVVVEGTASEPALRPRLEKWARGRAAARRAAVLGLIGREGGEP